MDSLTSLYVVLWKIWKKEKKIALKVIKLIFIKCLNGTTPKCLSLKIASFLCCEMDRNKSLKDTIYRQNVYFSCLNQCTYCKTKHARGELGSYPPEEIVARAKQSFEGKYSKT